MFNLKRMFMITPALKKKYKYFSIISKSSPSLEHKDFSYCWVGRDDSAIYELELDSNNEMKNLLTKNYNMVSCKNRDYWTLSRLKGVMLKQYYGVREVIFHTHPLDHKMNEENITFTPMPRETNKWKWVQSLINSHGYAKELNKAMYRNIYFIQDSMNVNIQAHGIVSRGAFRFYREASIVWNAGVMFSYHLVRASVNNGCENMLDLSLYLLPNGDNEDFHHFSVNIRTANDLATRTASLFMRGDTFRSVDLVMTTYSEVPFAYIQVNHRGCCPFTRLLTVGADCRLVAYLYAYGSYNNVSAYNRVQYISRYLV